MFYVLFLSVFKGNILNGKDLIEEEELGETSAKEFSNGKKSISKLIN